jgi:uncharacterized protein YkwD
MRRRRFAVLLALAGAVALAAPGAAVADAPAGTAADCPGADLQPAQDNLAQVASATLCLLNLERRVRDLPPLAVQGQLSQASTAFSSSMVSLKFFDHVSPDGGTLVDRLTAVGYLGAADVWAAGENIGWGTGTLSTAESMVQAWMNSPPHRENVLDSSFREIGLGIALGVPSGSDSGLGATYTTDFGLRELAFSGSTAASAPRSSTATQKVAVKTSTPRRCARTARKLEHASRRSAKRRGHTKRAPAKRRCTRA